MEKVNGNPIYTVIVCSKIELKTYERIKSDGTIIRVPSSFGFVVLGSHDVFGFFHEKELAFENVKMNACDICEACYDYAIIEEIYPGLYRPATNHWVFKYNRDTDEYIQIDEPEILKDTSNITWQSRWCD
jgi:hypothetical protein